jgi:D-alanyl-D-alanine carboxypeptidase/D-alanyl-D-alanine-endopeptidase (penicillin-binding protein 4)
MKLLLFLLICYSNQIFSQPNTQVNKAISNFIADTDLANASISISVIDANNGSWIANHNPNLSLIPASSMKLVTTGAALGMLSPTYVFKTEIQYDGNFDATTGVLNGNIFLKGYGDPTLGSDNMDGVPNLLEVMNIFGSVADKLNICTVNGRVIGDGGFFSSWDAIGSDWQWEDIGNYYGAGAYGLNIHENYYHLKFQQASTTGATPKILGTDPYVPEITFTNKVISAGSNTGDNTLIFTAPLSDESIVRGTIPIGSNTFRVKGAIPDPPAAAAAYFHNILKNQYKTVIRKSPMSIDDFSNPPTTDRKTIYTHYSPALTRIVEEANLESNNLFVESMLRAIAKAQNEEATPEKGCEIITNYWKGKGIDMGGFFMKDGSGLSARSGVTSRQLASMLYYLNNDASIALPFYNSLPKAGETGTLKNMFKGTKAVGNLRAKSGSMTRVRSYTGYVERPNGKRWSFSIMVNNYNCTGGEMRAKLEKLMLAFCEAK